MKRGHGRAFPRMSCLRSVGRLVAPMISTGSMNLNMKGKSKYSLTDDELST
ncbi:MAG: hypothetical protein ACTSUE_24805 [Promethearchaeota archaeon]